MIHLWYKVQSKPRRLFFLTAEYLPATSLNIESSRYWASKVCIFHMIVCVCVCAVEGEDQKKQAPLGNWVGPASGWHPSPSSQWFWTNSGEKLVPVLTYTAYLPFVDLPTLSATAVQLPLDVCILQFWILAILLVCHGIVSIYYELFRFCSTYHELT